MGIQHIQKERQALRLYIVMPCYNEAACFGTTVNTMLYATLIGSLCFLGSLGIMFLGAFGRMISIEALKSMRYHVAKI